MTVPVTGAVTGPVVGDLRWWQLDPVLALERQAFGAEAWSAETYWSELAQWRTRHYVAAWSGDDLVGYAGATATRDEGWVQTIAVAPAARGTGLSDDLLADLEAYCAGAGAPTVSLEVADGNVAAQRLYERHGYAVSGRRRAYYQPSGADALIMVKAL